MQILIYNKETENSTNGKNKEVIIRVIIAFVN